MNTLPCVHNLGTSDLAAYSSRPTLTSNDRADRAVNQRAVHRKAQIEQLVAQHEVGEQPRRDQAGYQRENIVQPASPPDVGKVARLEKVRQHHQPCELIDHLRDSHQREAVARRRLAGAPPRDQIGQGEHGGDQHCYLIKPLGAQPGQRDEIPANNRDNQGVQDQPGDGRAPMPARQGAQALFVDQHGKGEPEAYRPARQEHGRPHCAIDDRIARPGRRKPASPDRGQHYTQQHRRLVAPAAPQDEAADKNRDQPAKRVQQNLLPARLIPFVRFDG